MNAMTRPSRPKSFTWSYSALKNFETCERRHNEVDRQKNFKEEEGPALQWGHSVHSGLSKSLAHGTPLPAALHTYQPYVRAARDAGLPIKTELKLAMTRDFKPCDWMAPAVWFRSVIDVMFDGTDKAALWDWKTGKVLEDAVQLGLFATTVFVHFDRVEQCKTSYIWLNHHSLTNETWTRADLGPLWASLLPRVNRMESSFNSGDYQAMPSGLCKKYCPVDTCEYHGRGSY